MSRKEQVVITCDRCGKTIVDTSVIHLDIQKFARFRFYDKSMRIAWPNLDLCNNCFCQFRKFMEKGAEKNG